MYFAPFLSLSLSSFLLNVACQSNLTTFSELSLARSELEFMSEKRDLAVEFIFCLVLIEVLKQLSVHPGHEDLVQHIENLAFKHFRYRDRYEDSYDFID
jgi:Cell morphogenesis N-terminal